MRLPVRILFILLMFIAPVARPAHVRAEQGPSQGAAEFTVDDMLDIVNASISDLSRDGRFVAIAESSLRDRIGIDNSRFGDPTYVAPSLSLILVLDTQTGRSQRLFPDRKQVHGLKWSPDGSRLAFLTLNGGTFEPTIWDRASGKLSPVPVPKGKDVSDNAVLQWTPDGKLLLFSLNTDEWRKEAAERFKYETRGPIVDHSSKEPFLAWLDLRRMSALRSIAAHELQTGTTRELVPETRVNSYEVPDEASFLTYYKDITKKTDYDVIGGTDSQVQLHPLSGGDERTVIKDTHGLTIIWSKDGRHYAYSKGGDVFFASIDDKEPRQLTGKKDKAPQGDTSDKQPAGTDEDKSKAKESYTPVRLNRRADRLVASNKQGLWLIDTATGDRDLFLKMEEEDELAPRYQVIDWDSRGERIYLSYASRTKWERGVSRYDVNSKRLDDLMKDGRMYSGFRLSDDGGTLAFLGAENNRPPDVFVADSELKNVRRLVETNPQLKAKHLGKTELVSYLDADGRKLHGVLYYPSDYVPGKRYPTVFNLYEQFMDDAFNSTISVLNAHGYAVMQPSVHLETGFPGESWAKGVTAAANKLIENGIADSDRLGVQGTSYGGYATNLLITQTNRFKAAINISGKVDMISFYTDSPRLGVRNTHAPEKSQDRIGATLWQQPQKYIQHSAIFFADRIKTPLLLMTGELDSNVPARQAMEMYYALRRLGKDVEWVDYMRGGHGMPTSTVDEVRDYHKRILDWYDKYLATEKHEEKITSSGK
jgi:dipeptidyl aminopeptidase/acylaminoacyl peptidase